MKHLLRYILVLKKLLKFFHKLFDKHDHHRDMNQFSREIKWIKKNYRSILFWGVITFLLIPQIIFIIVKDDEHLGFLGGYIGAILTLGGVYYQLYKLEKHRREDEKTKDRERKLGVLKYLKFVLEKNINGGEKYRIAYVMQVNLSYVGIWNTYKEESNVFSKFKNQFIDDNLNVVMEFKNNIGKGVLDIERLILDTLKDYNYLLKHTARRKYLFGRIKAKGTLEEKALQIKGYNEAGQIESEFSKKLMDGLIEEMEEVLEEKEIGILEKDKNELKAYSMLDVNLNGKGFEIIEKSKELLKKVENEISWLV